MDGGDTSGDVEILQALLAGMTGAVTRDAAAAALAEWSRRPDGSLAEILRSAGGLDEGRLRAFSLLASAHYRAHGRDLARSLAAWDVPTIRDETATDVDPLLTVVAEVAGSDAAPTSRRPDDSPTPGRGRSGSPSRPPLDDRYDLVKIHAKGGIGQVWKAQDRQLQREVALKELQPRHADRDDLRARFLLEAEITGKLEHPGIVPVYSLGRDEAGRPYYAMRFVQGDSLAAAIRDFHEARKRAEAGGADPSDAWGVDFRQLLRRFLGACETLEYAHSKGYIHRDLKPGNIMVGPYGETLVVDWGLAKVIGSGPEARPSPGSDDDAEDRPTPTSATSPGDRLGTPQYMSPEQALGALDRVGPRSDVYSLGATLHELLTGEPPFPGGDQHAIVVAVLRGATPPRAVVRSIPPALESICLKAMAFDVEARYASAGDLARDLENWLADEPVSAHPERARERLARWIRRHRTWAYAAAAALLVVSVTATAAALSISRAWGGEREARAEAEENYNMAQQAVDDYLIRISQDTLLHLEDTLDMRRLRRDLLQTALDYYEKFVASRRDDPRLQRRLASAYHNVGLIRAMIDSPQDALKPLTAALATWEAMQQAAPRDRTLAAGRARTLMRLGQTWNDLDRPRDAITALLAAATALEALAALPDADPAHATEMADCYSDLSAIHAREGDREESRRALARARAVLQSLLDAAPGKKSYRRALAEVVNNQGYAAYEQGDFDSALRDFRESQAVFRELLEDVAPGEPRPLRLVELLGVSCYNAGDVLTTQGRFAEAMEAYQRSLAHRRELAESHPTVRRYREGLALTLRELAYIQHGLGRRDEATRSLSQARESFEQLIRSDPGRASLHHHLARTWNSIGHLADERRDHREAAEAFVRAIAEHRLAVAGAGDSLGYRFEMALSLANLAEQSADLGDLEEALDRYEEAGRFTRELASAGGANAAHLGIFVHVASVLGDLRLQAGDASGAIAACEDLSSTIRESRVAVTEEWREDALAEADARRAACLIASDRPSQASTLLAETAEGLRRRESTPNGRARLSEVLWLLARAERLCGRVAEAERAAAARRALWNESNHDGLVTAARRTASRACLLGHGTASLASSVGRAGRESEFDRAAEDLLLASSLGHDDRDPLLGDPDLATIVDRENFRRFHDDVSLPDQPFGPAPSP